MNTKFETSSVNQEQQDRIFSLTKIVKSDVAESSANICTFDVNQGGQIAVGFLNKKINIYNADCQFQYAYSFSDDGSYYVEWDNQDLLIYLVRGDIVIKVDDKGNYLEVKKIDNSINNTYYWNSFNHRQRKLINNYKYEMKNEFGMLNIFAVSYSKFVKTDTKGIETIVYDVSKNYTMLIIGTVLIVIVFITIIVICFVKQYHYNIKKL